MPNLRAELVDQWNGVQEDLKRLQTERSGAQARMDSNHAELVESQISAARYDSTTLFSQITTLDQASFQEQQQRYNKWLTIATFFMAGATVVLAVSEVRRFFYCP